MSGRGRARSLDTQLRQVRNAQAASRVAAASDNSVAAGLAEGIAALQVSINDGDPSDPIVLDTTAQTIVGAINELHARVAALEGV